MTSSRRRSGDLASLTMIDFEKRWRRCSSLDDSELARVDDDWRKRHAVPGRHGFEQLESADVGQMEIHHHAIEGRRLKLLERFGRCRYRHDAHVVDVQELTDAVALAFVVFHHEDVVQAL